MLQAIKIKKELLKIDKEILNLIESWRNELAKNVALRNKDLDLHDLNISIQKIIDRIIFLRIAEDKGTEQENRLLDLSKNDNIYENLIKIFSEANKKYNSGLFENKNWINKL